VNAGLSLLYLLRDLVRDILAFGKPENPSPEKLCEKTADVKLTGEELNKSGGATAL